MPYRRLPSVAEHPTFAAYGIWYRTDGLVRLVESFQDPRVEARASIQTDLDATTADIMLRLDVFDNHIRGWAWQAGDPMPADPIGEFYDDTLKNGSVGLWIETAGTPTSVVFRDFQVSATPIPEPSGMFLLTIAGVTVLSRRSLRRRPPTLERNMH